MKFFSSKNSIEADEITILAIIETMLAMFVSIFIAFRYSTTSHIFLGAALAPLLLLRTNFSTKLGLKWFDNYGYFRGLLIFITEYMEEKEVSKIFLIFLFPIFLFLPLIDYLMMGLYSVIVRIAATFVSFIKHPIKSITSIPTNWLRICLATDMKHPPEVMSGIEMTNSDEDIASLKWNIFLKGRKKVFFSGGIIEKILATYVFFLGFIFAYFPAFVYRFSLKSTSVIYLPFIWIIGLKLPEDIDLRVILDDFLISQIERVKRVYSLFVIVFQTVIPLFIFFYLQKITLNVQGEEVIKYFFPIGEINSWHITRLGSAIITFLLFFIADIAKIRIDNGNNSWNEISAFLLKSGKRFRYIMTM